MLFIAVLVLLVTLLYMGSRKPKGFPPGPPRYPLVGYIPFLEKHLIHKHMWRLSDTYGPVYGMYLGNIPVIVVNGWEAITESLSNEDLNGRPESIIFKLRDEGTQRGVMFVEGDLWKEQRRFSLHQFRNLGFGKRSHESVIHEEASELIKDIQEMDCGVQLQAMLGISSVNILWALMGGSRFQRNDQELIDLVDRLNKTFRAGDVAGGIVDILPIVHHIMPKSSKFGIVMDGFTLVRKFIKSAVDEHKRTLDQDNPRDFIDIYLIEMLKHNKAEETTFKEEQLVSLCTDIFSAGTETGSASVSFAILMSTLQPEVMEKIHQELDSVVGRERLPSMDDRSNLVYTEAVLTEVLRFRGPAPFTVPHKATRDTTLQGHHVPAETMLLNNLYSIQMDPDYWTDPQNFRPQRFINPDGTLRRDERLIPFGKGRRICLGESLARMTLFLLFTALMQKFTFKLDPSIPVPDTEGIGGFTLGPPKFKVFAKSRF